MALKGSSQLFGFSALGSGFGLLALDVCVWICSDSFMIAWPLLRGKLSYTSQAARSSSSLHRPQYAWSLLPPVSSDPQHAQAHIRNESPTPEYSSTRYAPRARHRNEPEPCNGSAHRPQQ